MHAIDNIQHFLPGGVNYFHSKQHSIFPIFVAKELQGAILNKVASRIMCFLR